MHSHLLQEIAEIRGAEARALAARRREARVERAAPQPPRRRRTLHLARGPRVTA